MTFGNLLKARDKARTSLGLSDTQAVTSPLAARQFVRELGAISAALTQWQQQQKSLA